MVDGHRYFGRVAVVDGRGVGVVGKTDRGRDSDSVPDLQTLITDARGTTSYDLLAAQSGGRLSSQGWQQLVKKPRKAFPDAETLQTISEVLQLRLTTVVLAAAKSLGLDVDLTMPRLWLYTPPGVNALTDVQVDAVVAVIRAMLDPGAAEDQAKIESSPDSPIRGTMRKDKAKPSQRRSQAG